LKILYVAPERLLMEEFLEFLRNAKISLFAIDEAHCISGWGHDFRPVYTELAILADKFPQTPRIALTATADITTRKDIISKLQLGDGKIFISSFDRPNINYTITLRENGKKQLLNFIKKNHAKNSGIVYCLSRKKVEETAAWLKEEGFNAFAYHAGMNSNVKNKNQQKFLIQDNVIMVATIAFGMGIDKPDVRFVAHLNVPKNIESYYQETGRAGRDGLPSDAWMCYGLNDIASQRNFIEESSASENQKRIERQKINSMLGLCETTNCRRKVLLEYFGEESEDCGNCDNCLNKPESFNGTIAAQKAISCVYRTDQLFGVGYLIDILLGNENERIKSFNHNQISTFGIGKDFSKQEWNSIFRQLVAFSLLRVDIAGHGGLKITEDGWQFLKEKKEISLRKYVKQSKEKAASKSKNSIRAIFELETDSEKELFDKLKKIRMDLAKKQNLPPYLIFHDKTLVEMAKIKPKSNNELANISGVGQKKIEQYGEIFLKTLA
jgi:ATP-dependent DNA helicase RecQ